MERIPMIDDDATNIFLTKHLLSSSQNPFEIERAKLHLAAAFLHKPLTKQKLFNTFFEGFGMFPYTFTITDKAIKTQIEC